MPTRAIPVTAHTPFSLAPGALDRSGAVIYNNTNKSVFVYLGSGSEKDEFTTVPLPAGHWEVPGSYKGEIEAVAPSGVSGNVNVTVW